MTAVRAAGRWRLRLCAGCGGRRMMPAGEATCRSCEPSGGPRSLTLTALRKERLRAGLAPEDLAVRAEVSMTTVRRAELGSRVRAATAVRLAGALGTGVRELTVHD